MVSDLAADPEVQREAVTAHSRDRPTVPALRKLKFWENPAPASAAMTELSHADNVNIKNACMCKWTEHTVDTFHTKLLVLVKF